MRWTIPRSLLLLVAVLGGLAVAARGGKKNKDKEAEEPPPEPVVEPEPEPAPEPAPALWEGSLPVVLQRTPEGLASLSAQSCNGCHYAAHDGWSAGDHAQAWRDPVYQSALASVGASTACVGCHLPLANQHARLAVGYLDGEISRPELQRNEAWDPSLMSEGVTCAACHVREGKILGVHEVAGGPHEVVVSPELQSSEACAACHQLTWPEADRPFYDTYGEWKASAYATAGVRCQDCHMPLEAGPAVATRFAAQASHSLSPQHGRALTAQVGLSAPEVQRGEPLRVSLRLLNTGAGHSVPTGSPFKTYTVEIVLMGETGEPLAEAWTHPVGREVDAEPPWRTLSDNRIPAGGELSLETEIVVSQRQKAQDGRLLVRLHRREGDTEPVLLQDIPLSIL